MRDFPILSSSHIFCTYYTKIKNFPLKTIIIFFISYHILIDAEKIGKIFKINIKVSYRKQRFFMQLLNLLLI